MTTHYLACDLGAESGRLMLGSLDQGRLTLEELHRFANTPLQAGGSLHWNIPQLRQELRHGLQKAAALGRPISSISTDSWGVDYILLDAQGELLCPTFHYRDARTARGVERARKQASWETTFDETGIQFMPLNSIYQLAAEAPDRLERAGRMLTIADGFNYFLSGVAAMEESSASTTQLYNPRTRVWSKRLLQALDLPERLFPRILTSGTRLGPLRPELESETGLKGVEVIAGCSHDTAAAVAAVPASGGNWAYLSSGTWSLMGVELDAPRVTDLCRELNFTNELGYGGSVRLLKNISGLWLVQECRRDWAAAGQEFDYATLTRLATEARPFVSLINPADPRFMAPGGMPARIADYCRETGQPIPSSPGAFIRCALESLALLYRQTLLQIEQLTGHKIERLHIVGGGSQNSLLNQLTANALQLPVLAGPTEATAAGNVLIQAAALGHLPSLSAIRETVRSSFQVTQVLPEPGAEWGQQYKRFEKLLG